MKLRDAQIDNMLDTEGNELTSVRKFGEVLRSAKLIADGYFNDHKAFSVPMGLYEDAGNLIASIDARFAFDPANTVTSLLIKVHHADSEDVLFQSFTNNLCFPLEAGDYDIDAYFKIISTWAGWPNKCNVPETKIRWLQTNRFKAEDLNEQPGPNDDSVDPGGDGDDSDTGELDSSCYELIDHTNYETFRDSFLGDYMDQWGADSGIGETWETVTTAHVWPWLAIKYNFDAEYDLVVKYNNNGTEEVRWDSRNTTRWNPIPTVSGPDDSPRTYFLLDTDDLGFGVNYQYTDGGVYNEEHPLLNKSDFKVYITPHV